MITGLALPQAFFRWYLREADSAKERRVVLGTTLAVRIAGSAMALMMVLLAAFPITDLLYEGDYLPVFLVAAPIVMFDSFNAIPLSVLRAERRPREFIRVSLTRAILASVLILILVVVFRIGVIGVAIGSAVAAAVAASFGAIVVLRLGMRPHLDRRLAAAMLAFAVPLIPASIAGWTLNLSDRPLLQAITGDTAMVGIYSLGYTVGLMVNALLVQPFTLAWGAVHWEMSRHEDAPARFARILTWFVAIGSGGALALSALGADAISLLVGPEFVLSRYIVPFSAFAYVLYGAYSIVAAGLGITGRSGQVAATMAFAAAATLLMNLLLIPRLGMYGAALSTVLGYGILALATGLLSTRVYPVPWQLPRVIVLLVLACILSGAALLGPDHVAWRIGCLVAYAALVIGLRIVDASEIMRVVRLLGGERR